MTAGNGSFWKKKKNARMILQFGLQKKTWEKKCAICGEQVTEWNEWPKRKQCKSETPFWCRQSQAKSVIVAVPVRPRDKLRKQRQKWRRETNKKKIEWNNLPVSCAYNFYFSFRSFLSHWACGVRQHHFSLLTSLPRTSVREHREPTVSVSLHSSL